MAHTCQNCGAVADDPGHLCNPADLALHCDYCGKHNVSAHHVCKGKLEAMKYTCSSCGRVAEDKQSLCKPEDIV
jgi:uncharacterized Zn finger protein